MKNTFFTVGPSAIYPDIPKWTADFFIEGFGSISHRSSTFENLYRDLDGQLRQLMAIPDTHAILIANSGSEIMERILQNCVRSESFHFINGSFSKKFYNYALRLDIRAQKFEVPYGDGFEIIPEISSSSELICITHNETSTGIKTPENFIHEVKKMYPEKILAVDTVSSAPLVSLDYSLVDICFFSSQKGFGLPAGLGIFIINKKLAGLHIREKSSHGRGAHNTLEDYVTNYENFQTPSTPNILGVYLMGLVAKKMNLIGRDRLFQEMTKKKDIFYKIFRSNPYLKLVNGHSLGSDTIIVSEFLLEKSQVLSLLKENQVYCSSGYGNFKESQLRFSNFPANSMEDILHLGDVLCAEI